MFFYLIKGRGFQSWECQIHIVYVDSLGSISGSIFYQVAVLIIILFALFSVYVLLMRVSNFDLEGWKDDEK